MTASSDQSAKVEVEAEVEAGAGSPRADMPGLNSAVAPAADFAPATAYYLQSKLEYEINKCHDQFGQYKKSFSEEQDGFSNFSQQRIIEVKRLVEKHEGLCFSEVDFDYVLKLYEKKVRDYSDCVTDRLSRLEGCLDNVKNMRQGNFSEVVPALSLDEISERSRAIVIDIDDSLDELGGCIERFREHLGQAKALCQGDDQESYARFAHNQSSELADPVIKSLEDKGSYFEDVLAPIELYASEQDDPRLKDTLMKESESIRKGLIGSVRRYVVKSKDFTADFHPEFKFYLWMTKKWLVSNLKGLRQSYIEEAKSLMKDEGVLNNFGGDSQGEINSILVGYIEKLDSGDSLYVGACDYFEEMYLDEFLKNKNKFFESSFGPGYLKLFEKLTNDIDKGLASFRRRTREHDKEPISFEEAQLNSFFNASEFNQSFSDQKVRYDKIINEPPPSFATEQKFIGYLVYDLRQSKNNSIFSSFFAYFEGQHSSGRFHEYKDYLIGCLTKAFANREKDFPCTVSAELTVKGLLKEAIDLVESDHLANLNEYVGASQGGQSVRKNLEIFQRQYDFVIEDLNKSLNNSSLLKDYMARRDSRPAKGATDKTPEKAVTASGVSSGRSMLKSLRRLGSRGAAESLLFSSPPSGKGSSSPGPDASRTSQTPPPTGR